MLRAAADRNARRRELRWVKARAASQLRDVQVPYFRYKPTLSSDCDDPGSHSRREEVCSPSSWVLSEGDCSDEGHGDTSEDDGTFEEQASSSVASETSLLDKLHDWAGSHNISHAALNDLLRILKELKPDLPCDARTLLATPRESPIRRLSNGEYVHFGLKAGLAKCLSSGLRVADVQQLHVTLNIDGLPLFKNSSRYLWPILAMVEETKDRGPFPIGIFCGVKKPASLDDYLDEFMKEMCEVQREGVVCSGKRCQVIIRAVMCDYPARVFVQCAKGHTSYYGCDKCTQTGKWLGRMTFPDSNAPLRTDASFNAQLQEEHHIGVSPMQQLGLKMVTQFPIDYMHLVLLGVVRKFVKYWAEGPYTVRRSDAQLTVINERISLLHPYTPCDFSRKLRPMKDGERWKATEARLFLLYICPCVLKGMLTEESYEHFLVLHVAIRILCAKDSPNNLVSYAEELLKFFVEKARSEKLYGETVSVYNVHGLIHLAQDARTFGPLDCFSGFRFENYLGSLKRAVRSGNRPLAQVFKRIMEKNSVTSEAENVRSISHEHIRGPMPAGVNNARQFGEVVYNGCTLKTTEPDNCILLHTGKFAIVENILSCDGKVCIVGKRFRSVEDLYTYPCRSSLLDVAMVSRLSLNNFVCELDDIKAKCCLFPSGNAYACFPILHSRNS
ncbi:uncharacterized protein LOC144164879 [Haemaphysalis longicornis]